MDVTDLQARIAENIKVLLATTGIRTQAALARALGWEAAKVTRLLKGTQEWTLSDLVAVSEALGLADPFLITRSLIEVVNATGPAATANSRVTNGDTLRYPASFSASGSRLAPVIPIRPGYQTVTTTERTASAPITHVDAGYRGQRADTA
jgi:hypothetical protein